MTGHEATSVIMRWMFLSYFYEEVEDYSCCTERIIVHANIGAICRSITAKVLLLLPLQWHHAQRKQNYSEAALQISGPRCGGREQWQHFAIS